LELLKKHYIKILLHESLEIRIRGQHVEMSVIDTAIRKNGPIAKAVLESKNRQAVFLA
jgi:hypothetical protein